jgi:hypothetical protein
MKKKFILSAMMVSLLALGLVFTACGGGKKSSGSADSSSIGGSNTQTRQSSDDKETTSINTSKSSGNSTGKEAPASDFKYDLNETGDGVVIQGYKGNATTLIVPSEIEGFPVTEMFKNCKALKSFTIPEGITFIGLGAFESSGLTSIVIPEGVKVIAVSAFMYCKDLKSVTLPESLEVLGPGAFSGCINLETIKLPSHRLEWNEYEDYDGGYFGNHDSQAFKDCTKLSLASRKAIQDLGYKDGF